MSDTYISVSYQDLKLLQALGDSLPANLRDIVNIRLAELDNPETQKRHAAYRAGVEIRDGEIEVDDNALVSEGEDPGAYVMAWVWVSNDEDDED